MKEKICCRECGSETSPEYWGWCWPCAAEGISRPLPRPAPSPPPAPEPAPVGYGPDEVCPNCGPERNCRYCTP